MNRWWYGLRPAERDRDWNWGWRQWPVRVAGLLLAAAALTLGGCGGGVTPLPPPTAWLPAPQALQMTAVSLSLSAYRWLAAIPASDAGVGASLTTAATTAPKGLASLLQEVLPSPPSGAGEATVAPTVLGPDPCYVELDWHWPSPKQTPVDHFRWGRAGQPRGSLPVSEGVAQPGTGELSFTVTDSTKDLTPGAEGSLITYEVTAQQGELVGPTATVRGKVLPVLNDPVLTEPADQAVASAAALPVLRWQGDPRADGYQVEVVREATGSPIGTWFTTGTTLALNQISPAAGGWLAGQTYSWRVLAVRSVPAFSPQRNRYESVSLSLSASRRFRLQ